MRVMVLVFREKNKAWYVVNQWIIAVGNSCLTHSCCLILPLFVAELQDPLHVLLGHWVIAFQCLKENRWHYFSRKCTVVLTTWQIPQWELFQSTHKAAIVYTVSLNCISKCILVFKVASSFKQQSHASVLTMSHGYIMQCNMKSTTVEKLQ